MTFEIEYLGGHCPVQAEGAVNNTPFYFRARGSSWSLGVGGDTVLYPAWSYEEDYGEGPYDAGWMTHEEARAFLDKAVKLYLQET